MESLNRSINKIHYELLNLSVLTIHICSQHLLATHNFQLQSLVLLISISFAAVMEEEFQRTAESLSVHLPLPYRVILIFIIGLPRTRLRPGYACADGFSTG